MPGESVTPEPIPARMLNEHVYCPRLAYLEWVQGEWDDNADTVDGRFVHRRVDAPSHAAVPEAADLQEGMLRSARSLMLSSERLGAVAKVDLVEAEGTRVTPVDYKRGRVPDNEHRAYDPERVQLCLAGLLLRDNGYDCDGGVLYFVESRTRVDVPFDDELVALTMRSLDELRQTAAKGIMPPPLVDSPKCPRCSLVGICMPDEVNVLRGEIERPRRLRPARDDRLPLYVLEQGAYLGKKGDRLHVTAKGEELATVRMIDVSQVSLFGNVQVSAPALRELCNRGIPISHLSWGGWFYGITTGHGHRNVEARIAQYRAADAPGALALAAAFVAGKIRNQRTLLRRNLPDKDGATLTILMRCARRARLAADAPALLGIEGFAARTYFEAFPRLFRNTGEWAGERFQLNGRNRRPPRDEVNAVLSFLYAMLIREAHVAVSAVGLDPYRGLFHAVRYGKPALALDLCEEFRPIVADSVCITLFNQGELTPTDFIRRARGVALTDPARKSVIRAYERCMARTVRHPLFGYTVSYRRILEVQARLLRAHLLDEVPAYVPFGTR